MNPRKFIQLLQEDKQFRESVERHVWNEMESFGRRENITKNDISEEELNKLAESFVERGLHEKP